MIVLASALRFFVLGLATTTVVVCANTCQLQQNTKNCGDLRATNNVPDSCPCANFCDGQYLGDFGGCCGGPNDIGGICAPTCFGTAVNGCPPAGSGTTTTTTTTTTGGSFPTDPCVQLEAEVPNCDKMWITKCGNQAAQCRDNASVSCFSGSLTTCQVSSAGGTTGGVPSTATSSVGTASKTLYGASIVAATAIGALLW